MSKEYAPGGHEADLSRERRERLLWRNNEVRKAAKDLRLNVYALPEEFPDRLKVLQMVDEILTLVPVLDPEDEARDEQERRELSQKLKRAHDPPKKGFFE